MTRRETLQTLKQLKNFMEKSIDNMESDDFCNSQFEFGFRCGSQVVTTQMYTNPEIWEMFENLVLEAWDMLTDESMYGDEESERIEFLKAYGKPYTQTNYDYCEKSDTTYIMKETYEKKKDMDPENDDYVLKEREVVGFFYGRPEDCPDKWKYMNKHSARFDN